MSPTKFVNEPKAMQAFIAGEGLYVCVGANTIESISAGTDAQKDIFFQKLWLYPAKAIAAGGKLTANVGDVYLGKSGADAATPCTPDKLQPTDVNGMVYQLPAGQKMRLAQIIIQGAIGDGVFFSYT